VHFTCRRILRSVGKLVASLLGLILIITVVPARISSSVLHDHMSTEGPNPFRVEPVVPGDDGVRCRHTVAPGDSFASILQAHGLSAAEIRAWEQAASPGHDLGKLLPRHALILTFAKDQGRLTAVEYELDDHVMLSMRVMHGQIRTRMKATPQLATVRGMAGKVDATLATSATAAGLPATTLSELAELFGWDLDLDNDIRAGDEFRVVYRELRDPDGGMPRPGPILAAEIRSGDRTFTAFRFENTKGEIEYYDGDGRALGRDFLKYPVDFAEISSQFSGSRWHPVLKRARPHRGVDFRAPRGTPVHAVADGVVNFAGRNGQYGQQVGIDHEKPYTTSYAHLQRIGAGIRPGALVRKGQVIGYVGSTGLATGSHLHFEMYRDGEYVDPLRVRLPSDETLAGAARRKFLRMRGELSDRLAAVGPAIDLPALSRTKLSLLELTRSRLASFVD
jgi:murein DD-endopeptidase MepM/ murein hydrolase activator NlpD